eukprot:TRINITY_DN2825_c1_g1_i1.p1 TRINITY_DN2825_c1_g1~~TRINITY_DN2825_c1_g1_i1.p1  ORF type:complete len:822 (+),score=137.00 TRINITY_DN2825_c1_g1_i1:59-2524(+)
MGSRVLKCLSRLLFKDGDDETMKVRKLSLFTFAVATLVTGLPVRRILTGEGGALGLLASILNGVTSITCLVLLVVFKYCDTRMYVGTLCAWALVIMLLDIFLASASEDRASPIFVIIFDLLLVGGVDNRISLTFVSVILAFVALSYSEHALRFGLFDMWGTASMEARLEKCSCGNPPCPWGGALASRGFFTTALVFTVDFFLTRRFAVTVQTERNNMQLAVKVANDIATCLASFDLEAAEMELLVSGATLPGDLETALSTLLNNLRTYRPFLPNALFMTTDTGLRVTTAQQYIGQNGHAALVQLSIPMAKSQSHEATFRGIFKDSVSNVKGVVVGVVTSSSEMLATAAFYSCRDAVSVSQKLLSEYLAANGVKAGKAPPADVMMRIGVHYGKCNAQRNPDTADMEFGGAVVDELGAVYAASIANSLTVSQCVLDELNVDVSAGFAAFYHNKAKGVRRAKQGMPFALASLVPRGMHDLISAINKALSVDLDAAECTSGEAQSGSAYPANDISSSGNGTDLQRRVGGEGGRKAVATLVTMKPTILDDSDAQMWQNVETCATQCMEIVFACAKDTSGVIVSTMGGAVSLSWGAFRACRNHIDLSAQYLANVERRLCAVREFDDTTHPSYHAGWATGPVHSGRIRASDSAVFMSILGPTVDMSVMLAVGAAELGTHVLSASLSTWPMDLHHYVYPEGRLRPVDIWDFSRVASEWDQTAEFWTWNVSDVDDEPESEEQAAGGEELLIMTETDVLNSVNYSNVVVYEFKLQAESSPSTWTMDYEKAFFNRDLNALKGFAQDDSIAGAVVDMMQAGRHLNHAFIKRKN